MSSIYLDNNATTRPSSEVVEAMLPFLTEHFYNPSSPYPGAEAVADALRRARGQVARLLGAERSDEVTFTSGGTESIQSSFEAAAKFAKGRTRLITSTVEHSAAKATARRLTEQGFDWIQIQVDGEGRLDRDALFSALDERTALVSLLIANNETGVCTDLAGVGEACRAAGARFHLDAVQMPGKGPLNVCTLGADYASLAAHKFHGPKGVGALYVRHGAPFAPLVVGGPQESERRAGTENVPGSIGMGHAAELARAHGENPATLAHMGQLRDRLEEEVLAAAPGSSINGGTQPRVPNTTSITFPGVDADTLLMLLGEAGVAASAGSACDAKRRGPSPVLVAMGRTEEEATRTLRFSTSHDTTGAEITAAALAVKASVEALGPLG
jgi:cysteine desulfurase